MGKTIAIAMNTFKEAVRNRILYILLIFALIIMASSGILGELTISARDRIIKDLGIASINFFGVLIAIFVGIGLVYNELDKKTIYTIVTKPIHRRQFLIGKYLGLLLTIYVNMLIMTFFFLAVIHYQNYMDDETMLKALWKPNAAGQYLQPGFFDYAWYYISSVFMSAFKSLATFTLLYNPEITRNILKIVFYGCLELGIITGFAILYSSFSTPTLSAIFTVLTFVIGRLNADIIIFADRMKEKGLLTMGAKIRYNLSWIAAHVTPNLWLFDKRNAVAEDAPLLSIDPYALIYFLFYTGAVLYMAVMIFRRRNFK
ncbi:ABC transporter permease subunit [Candidatus Sumerlaeota bacterium]|nr:ABC transporter permease subunit [Candidatus Sumerlaeota bacterium]